MQAGHDNRINDEQQCHVGRPLLALHPSSKAHCKKNPVNENSGKTKNAFAKFYVLRPENLVEAQPKVAQLFCGKLKEIDMG
jgi:hypothetical protein